MTWNSENMTPSCLGSLMWHQLHVPFPEMGDITQLDSVFHAVLMNVSQNDYFKWHRMRIQLAALRFRCDLWYPLHIYLSRVGKNWIPLYKRPFMNTCNSGTNPNMDATWSLEWWSMPTSGQLPEFFFQRFSAQGWPPHPLWPSWLKPFLWCDKKSHQRRMKWLHNANRKWICFDTRYM